MRFENVNDVVKWRLCLGCGACYYVCPEKKIKFLDIKHDGLRPLGPSEKCEGCDSCLNVCPGIHSSFDLKKSGNGRIPEEQVSLKWGSILELWEGYAGERSTRFMGSSGGICSALSIFSIKENLAGGVLHIGLDQDAPYKNKTYRSTNREEILSRSGSRYAPASVCNRLDLMETADTPSVFIGKPCDVDAFCKVQREKPELAEKSALSIGFFCAGTPSTQGTLDFLKKHDTDPSALSGLRYRGMGWPGLATIASKDSHRPDIKVTYEDSWGFLQQYRPHRCYLCPDLTAEYADISVGDPWYRELGEEDPGHSLILIRTKRGRHFFQKALEKGVVIAKRRDSDLIYQSQHNLLGKRQAIWGRLLAMKLMRIPTPQLKGFHLFRNWKELSVEGKVRSISGTVKRIIKRRYHRPLDDHHIDSP